MNTTTAVPKPAGHRAKKTLENRGNLHENSPVIAAVVKLHGRRAARAQ